jgi:hypothetical protein
VNIEELAAAHCEFHFHKWFFSDRIWICGSAKRKSHLFHLCVTTVTIEQWALIEDCLFTSNWFLQFWHMTNNIVTKWELSLKSAFGRSRNSIFTNKRSKSQYLQKQQFRKRERKIKSAWNLGSLKHYLICIF